MKPTRRLLAGLAALLTVTATACDSSPFAASVGGQVIKSSSLNASLRQLAGNPYYVREVRQGYISKPVTVAGAGTGSYSSSWTAGVLSDMVVAAVVRQRLSRAGRLPNVAQLDASRAVDAIFYGPGAWDRFSAAFRSQLVSRDADLALAEPNLVSAAALKSVDTTYATQLFSRVCVRTVAVSAGSAGRVDYPASLAQARSLVARINASAAGGSGAASTSFGGQVTCYSASTLPDQPLGFVTTVLGLRDLTAAAPQRTPYGYQVLAVDSRTEVPAGPALAQAFTVAVNQARGTTSQVLASLLTGVHVKVNPHYGRWAGGGRVPYGVVAPSTPGLS